MIDKGDSDALLRLTAQGIEPLQNGEGQCYPGIALLSKSIQQLLLIAGGTFLSGDREYKEYFLTEGIHIGHFLFRTLRILNIVSQNPENVSKERKNCKDRLSVVCCPRKKMGRPWEESKMKRLTEDFFKQDPLPGRRQGILFKKFFCKPFHFRFLPGPSHFLLGTAYHR